MGIDSQYDLPPMLGFPDPLKESADVTTEQDPLQPKGRIWFDKTTRKLMYTKPDGTAVPYEPGISLGPAKPHNPQGNISVDTETNTLIYTKPDGKVVPYEPGITGWSPINVENDVELDRLTERKQGKDTGNKAELKITMNVYAGEVNVVNDDITEIEIEREEEKAQKLPRTQRSLSTILPEIETEKKTYGVADILKYGSDGRELRGTPVSFTTKDIRTVNPAVLSYIKVSKFQR